VISMRSETEHYNPIYPKKKKKYILVAPLKLKDIWLEKLEIKVFSAYWHKGTLDTNCLKV